MMQISSSTSALSALFNPRQDMDDKIATAVGNGSISDTDASVLESALDSIDESLDADTSGSRLDPSQMKERIDSLISDQVESGDLTQEQASALQSLFAQGPSQGAPSGSGESGEGGPGGAGGPSGPGGPRGAGGPPPGASSTQEAEETDETDSTETEESDEAEESEEADAALAALQAFLENLQAQQAEGVTYTASAVSSAGAAASGLIVDQLA